LILFEACILASLKLEARAAREAQITAMQRRRQRAFQKRCRHTYTTVGPGCCTRTLFEKGFRGAAQHRLETTKLRKRWVWGDTTGTRGQAQEEEGTNLGVQTHRNEYVSDTWEKQGEVQREYMPRDILASISCT
jgi:hypothetical protein